MSTINFDYKGESYALEFTADTASQLQGAGFEYEEVITKPNRMIPLLVHFAFRANHKKTPAALIDEIYKAMPNKEELVKALVICYQEAVEALFDDPETEEGNINWVVQK